LGDLIKEQIIDQSTLKSTNNQSVHSEKTALSYYKTFYGSKWLQCIGL
jgi:hypothetical protein